MVMVKTIIYMPKNISHYHTSSRHAYKLNNNIHARLNFNIYNVNAYHANDYYHDYPCNVYMLTRNPCNISNRNQASMNIIYLGLYMLVTIYLMI